MSILSLQSVQYSYGSFQVLQDLDLSITQGQWISLLGPNGCGKSTLLKILSGNLKPTRGHLKWGERSGLKSVVYIPQRMQLLLSVPVTVREFLELRARRMSCLDQVVPTLKKLEIPSQLWEQRLNTLSGGQLQRALIAYAIVAPSQLYLMDEVHEGLDLGCYKLIMTALKDHLKSTQGTVIWVSHDLSQSVDLSDRVICLQHKILFDGSATQPGFKDVINKMYFQGFQLHGH